jgi:ABC-type branched-subunit amino acid transport system permease subunit
MKALGRYTIAGLLIVAVATLGLWPFFGPTGHRSLLFAAGVALPVQVGAFALLMRAGGHPTKFLLWWAVGVLGRMAVVIAVGLGITRLEGIEPSILLLATAGFFFALLLIEPAFFDRTKDTAQFAQ